MLSKLLRDRNSSLDFLVDFPLYLIISFRQKNYSIICRQNYIIYPDTVSGLLLSNFFFFIEYQYIKILIKGKYVSGYS